MYVIPIPSFPFYSVMQTKIFCPCTYSTKLLQYHCSSLHCPKFIYAVFFTSLATLKWQDLEVCFDPLLFFNKKQSVLTCFISPLNWQWELKWIIILVLHSANCRKQSYLHTPRANRQTSVWKFLHCESRLTFCNSQFVHKVAAYQYHSCSFLPNFGTSTIHSALASRRNKNYEWTFCSNEPIVHIHLKRSSDSFMAFSISCLVVNRLCRALAGIFIRL